VLASPAGEAYVRMAGVIWGAARLAAAKAGRAILEDIILSQCSSNRRKGKERHSTGVDIG
jgi:hypothetical protein